MSRASDINLTSCKANPATAEHCGIFRRRSAAARSELLQQDFSRARAAHRVDAVPAAACCPGRCLRRCLRCDAGRCGGRRDADTCTGSGPDHCNRPAAGAAHRVTVRAGADWPAPHHRGSCTARCSPSAMVVSGCCLTICRALASWPPLLRVGFADPRAGIPRVPASLACHFPGAQAGSRCCPPGTRAAKARRLVRCAPPQQLRRAGR